MNDISAPPIEPISSATAAADETLLAAIPTADWVRWALIFLSVIAAGALWFAWSTQRRVHGLEQELVHRQQDSQNQATEAHILAKQAQELSRESMAHTTLLETRVAEMALQRTQIEDLIKTLSQSRDENVVADIEAGLRVAVQQSALTSSAAPLIASLQSADDRLKHVKLPRLDNVRRLIAKDLDRIRSTRVADLPSLSIRLDEAIRLLDEVPLLNQPEALMAGDKASPQLNGSTARAKAAANSPSTSPNKVQAPAAVAVAVAPNWNDRALNWVRSHAQSIWDDTRGLVRLTHISRPEAMLLSPEQGFFLRENLKLRLLNARLALLSSQTRTTVSDLTAAQQALNSYFNVRTHKAQLLQSILSDVINQSQQTQVPRPDDTLAALATVNGGR